MNQTNCLFFPLFHKAIPFHTASQAKIKTNNSITVGAIPNTLYNELYNTILCK